MPSLRRPVGALAGAATGLSVGLLDLSDRQLGMGAIVMRDTWYGTTLGATAGLIAGTISWVSGDEPEHLLAGAAWGAVLGAPIGVVIGIIEGNAFENELRERRTQRRGVGSPPWSAVFDSYAGWVATHLSERLRAGTMTQAGS